MKHLMTLIVTCSLTILSLAPASGAVDPHWQNPEAKFAANKNTADSKQITWRYTNNVQKDCEAESHKRKLGGFGYAVNACSFWDRNSCTIITAPQATMHILGHELRHCFQGSFH